MFESVKEMTDAVKPAATVLSDRVSVTNAGAVDAASWSTGWPGPRRSAATPSCAAPRAGSSAVAGGGRRHPARVDSRPVHGDGPRRRRRLHRAGDQRARDGLRHGARRDPRRRRQLNAGAFIFEIARSEIGYTEQRPHEYAAIVLAAALREGFTRPALHPGRSRPDQRQEIQQPRARQGARRRCAR